MSSPEIKNDNTNITQKWDMSDVPFAGAEKEKISKALRYAPDLLSITSEIFSDTGRTSNFTNAILSDKPNNEILNNIKQLDDGDYFENYGVDSTDRGYTGLGQVSGALDYFDNKYESLIDNKNLKGLIKTSLAMWPMGNLGNFGVQAFARSAKIDNGTANLIYILIDRNAIKLAQAKFEHNDQIAGEQLLQTNKNYLDKVYDSFSDNTNNAICICNLQKIIMDCAKNGATIAKERKTQK